MSKRARNSVTLSAAIRAAVLNSGRPRNQIAIETGIDPAALHRFVKGERGLSVDNLDRLGEALALVVVPESTIMPGRKRRRRTSNS